MSFETSSIFASHREYLYYQLSELYDYERRNSGKWIEISKHKPHFEEEVLVLLEDKIYKAKYLGVTQKKCWEFLDKVPYNNPNPIYWKPQEIKYK